ncbi:11221_t:CDS:2, partial [Scutellospora calospora]
CKTSRAEKKKLADDIDKDSILFFTFHIKLDKDILTSVRMDITIMAKLIINKIEEGVRTAYFICSQSNKIKHEYKDSNRKRTDWFSCNGKLNINIDILAANAKVTLQHELVHEKPIDVTTPLEIKQEILENLNMDSKFYKHNEDHIISACTLIEGQKKKEYNLCFQLETSYVTAIGFTTPLFGSLYNITEVHCDTMYKTAKGRFKLYGLVGNVEGAGFFLAYLILDTSKTGDRTQERLHTEALQDNVIDLIKKHFHIHPKIPTSSNGQFLSPVEIRIIAVRKIYEFSHSTHETIPLGKTNMMIEAHWKSFSNLQAFNSYSIGKEYPFLIWDGSETQNIPENIPSLTLCNQTLVENTEKLTNNNLQHVEAVVNNLGHVFTIINDIEIAKAR